LLPLQLLELGRKYGVKAFVNTDTILDKGVNHYSLSKNQFKEWLTEYSQDLTCCNVALEHFYGPADDPTKFVSYIIGSFLDKKASIPLTLGYQKRDFIFIDDVVDALELIVYESLKLEKGFIKYEIGTGDAVSIRHFVELIKELTGNTTTAINYGEIPYRTNEVMNRTTDISAINKLGWTSKYSLAQGLKKTIQYEKDIRRL
jgi:CDP-paratose synthetase